MRTAILWFCLVLSGPVACQSLPSKSPEARSTVSLLSNLNYDVRSQTESNIHVVRIPAGNTFVIEPAIATDVTSVSNFKSNAVAVINAGFFDPVNQKSTSHVTIARQPVARPQDNDRLTQNPKLKPYLPQIFDRSEFRRYQCGSAIRYGITRHETLVPKDCELVDAVGAGPQLLPKLTAIEEGFWDPSRGRDAIGYDQPNARSAIALTATGEVLLVMVEQQQSGGGLSLPQLALLLKDLGAVSALNLDGGTSSALWVKGKVHFGKRDETGALVGRSVKSVWVVKAQDSVKLRDF